MKRSWMVGCIAVVTAWSLACSGEVTVNDAPLGEEPADEEPAPDPSEPEEEEEVDEAPSRQEVVDALKRLPATVGDLHESCRLSAGDQSQRVAKWVAAQRKLADETEIDCDGTACTLTVRKVRGDEWMLALTFDVVDGDIDAGSIRCTAAG